MSSASDPLLVCKLEQFWLPSWCCLQLSLWTYHRTSVIFHIAIPEQYGVVQNALL